MKNLFKAGAAALALTLSGGSAAANEFYIGVFGGFAFPTNDLELRNSTFWTGNRMGNYFSSSTTRTAIFQQSVTTAWQGELEGGWVVGAALGYYLNENLRIEFEEAYRRFSIEGSARGQDTSRAHLRLFDGGSFTGTFDVTEQAAFDAEADGSRSAWSLMANLWHDFDLGSVTPFVGAGVGIAYVDQEFEALELPATSSATLCDRPDPYPDACLAPAPVHRIHETGGTWAFAYQAAAGLGWDLGDSAILSAQYRFFGTAEPEIGNGQNSIQSHEILLGINIPFDRR